MSLREAYTLAHTAQCRLNLEASRPDRNLRYVVGHLQHYESLRLRIVEIEHDLSTKNPSTSLHFHRLQHQPSTGQLGKTAPAPPAASQLDEDDAEEDDYDDALFDDEEDDGLSLSRFPSGASRAPAPPVEHHDPEPDLSHSPSASSDEYDEDEEEDDSDYDDDFLISYPTPSKETLQATIEGAPDPSITKLYEKVRGCPCHGPPEEVPSFERMWELPGQKNGRGRKGSVTVLGQEKSNAATTVQVAEVAA